jgi:hypothetical protein
MPCLQNNLFYGRPRSILSLHTHIHTYIYMYDHHRSCATEVGPTAAGRTGRKASRRAPRRLRPIRRALWRQVLDQPKVPQSCTLHTTGKTGFVVCLGRTTKVRKRTTKVLIFAHHSNGVGRLLPCALVKSHDKELGLCCAP